MSFQIPPIRSREYLSDLFLQPFAQPPKDQDFSVITLYQAVRQQIPTAPHYYENGLSQQEQADAIRRWLNRANLDQITSINLSNQGLTVIPEEIGLLHNLHILDLANNQIDNISPEMERLTKLQELNFCNNLIQTIPSKMANLTDLQVLLFRSNQIGHIPPEMARLTNLQHFIISDNRIQSIPSEIERLTDLQNLDLSYNFLTELPQEILSLPQVCEIDARDNYFSLEYIANVRGQIQQIQAENPNLGPRIMMSVRKSMRMN